MIYSVENSSLFGSIQFPIAEDFAEAMVYDGWFPAFDLEDQQIYALYKGNLMIVGTSIPDVYEERPVMPISRYEVLNALDFILEFETLLNDLEIGRWIE